MRSLTDLCQLIRLFGIECYGNNIMLVSVLGVYMKHLILIRVGPLSCYLKLKRNLIVFFFSKTAQHAAAVTLFTVTNLQHC
jgi:hypothetical protein